MYNNKFGLDQKRKNEIDWKSTLEKQSLKNFYYYQNDHHGILEFLNEHLSGIIKDGRVLELMPRVYLNDIPRIVKRMSMVYKTKPEREFSTTNEEALKEIDKLSKYYKEFHRQSKLLNTVLIRPVYRGEKLEFDIRGRHSITVIEDEIDYNKANEVFYPVYVTLLGSQEPEYINIHWTDEDNWATDENGNIIPPHKLPNIIPEDEKNPYKAIPFVKLKLQETTDYWGDGLSDIVNFTEANNAKLCDALYKQWLSFGYPIGTNLNLVADEFDIAPYKPIMVEMLRNDIPAPSLEFITPDHKIENDQSLIDWSRKSIGNTKGMSGSSMDEDSSEMSGYRKMLDELEMIEANEEDKEVLRDFEYSLWDMIRVVDDKTGTGKLKNVKLQSINFGRYEPVKTPEEIWYEREQEYKYNLSTPIDWLKGEGYSEKDAKQVLQENRKLKIELGERPNLFERIVNE